MGTVFQYDFNRKEQAAGICFWRLVTKQKAFVPVIAGG